MKPLLTRRSLLLQLLGLGTASAGVALAGLMSSDPLKASPLARRRAEALPFQPLRGPIPLPGDGLSAADQQRAYARVALQDQLLLPEGYRSDVLVQWGDPLGSGRFGFNNDYLAFTPLDAQRALLTVNFEYISPRPWLSGYGEVMGRELPFQELRKLLAARGGKVDALTLAADDPLRRPLLAVATAAMEDVGIGVVEIERSGDQPWRLPQQRERPPSAPGGLQCSCG
jgi:secreted PhoX family phosphatase